MASMTFLINDQSTGGGTPVLQVTITEQEDGTVKIELKQLLGTNSYLGDLRGFFFDIGEDLIGTLDVVSASKQLASGQWTTASDGFTQGDDSVRSDGSSSNNMNG